MAKAAERRKHSRVPSVNASSDGRECSVQGQRSTPNLGMLLSETARGFKRCPGAQQLQCILKISEEYSLSGTRPSRKHDLVRGRVEVHPSKLC